MNTKELILIKEKVESFTKYILEYGYNEEYDIFIKKELNNMKDSLDEFEKKINNEERNIK
jgi:hypothetical protein